MRVSGNTAWLEKKDWNDFTDYEEEINKVIGKYRMMALCTYSLDKCGPNELIDVVGNHQFAIIRRSGRWELIESSERKLREGALRESEERYRSLMESTDDSVYAVDGDCRYIYMNEKNLSRLGASSAKVIGKMYRDFHSQEGTEKFKKRIKQVLRTGKSITHEYQSERDGKFFLRTYSPVRKPNDKPNTVIVISKDITERKQGQEKLMRYQTDLKRLSIQIIKSQEEERGRISRELHDEIGQALTGVSINLSAIQGELPQDLSPGMKDRFSETGGLVDTMLEQVQSISLDLRPSILDDLGLIPALRWYTESFKKRTNIKTQFQIVNVKKGFQPEIDTTIYRIVQEALTNVARHAEADLVRVRLKGKESQIEVSIEDNGKGFELEDARSPYPTTHGIGLFGIQERVALLDGNTQILTKLGMGTKIIINIPIGVQS